MTRISLWALSTISVLVLVFGYHTSTEGAAATATPPAVYSGTLAGTTTGPTNRPKTGPTNGQTNGTSPSSARRSSSSSSSSAAPATYTGDTAQTQWGPVQVELTVADGTITGVDVLQHPSGNGTDEEINSYALPRLVQSTLDQQSVDIDMVSGATVTSVGYKQSLQSAIDQAGL